MNNINSSTKSEEIIKLNDHNSLLSSKKKLSNDNITEIGIQFCARSKRKFSDNHFPIKKFALSNQSKLLEEFLLLK
jgi:hypothetical protein